MPVETVNQSLDRRLVQVTNIASRLPRFLASDKRLRVDTSESIDDDFTTDRLDRINDDGHCARVQLLE